MFDLQVVSGKLVFENLEGVEECVKDRGDYSPIWWCFDAKSIWILKVEDEKIDNVKNWNIE